MTAPQGHSIRSNSDLEDYQDGGRSQGSFTRRISSWDDSDFRIPEPVVQKIQWSYDGDSSSTVSEPKLEQLKLKPKTVTRTTLTTYDFSEPDISSRKSRTSRAGSTPSVVLFNLIPKPLSSIGIKGWKGKEKEMDLEAEMEKAMEKVMEIEKETDEETDEETGEKKDKEKLPGFIGAAY